MIGGESRKLHGGAGHLPPTATPPPLKDSSNPRASPEFPKTPFALPPYPCRRIPTAANPQARLRFQPLGPFARRGEMPAHATLGVALQSLRFPDHPRPDRVEMNIVEQCPKAVARLH